MQRILLLLTSLFSLAVYAVKPAAQFRLPTSDAVQCMTFDTKGYLWIGTSSGLYSYDGYQYRNYRNSLHTPDRLANNNVQSLTTDHDGHLWIGTYDGVTRMSLISGERRHSVSPMLTTRLSTRSSPRAVAVSMPGRTAVCCAMTARPTVSGTLSAANRLSRRKRAYGAAAGR